jgi:outer membrane protein OmpA-like peptidoglycan-associated protein
MRSVPAVVVSLLAAAGVALGQASSQPSSGEPSIADAGTPATSEPPSSSPDLASTDLDGGTAESMAFIESESLRDTDVLLWTRERYLPGSEPHSPATWPFPYGDPRTQRDTLAARGGLGLLELQSADLGPAGLFRLGLQGEYARQRRYALLGRNHTRAAGAVALSFVPVDLLELYGSVGFQSHSDTAQTPRVYQSLGDVTLGAKLASAFEPQFHGGIDVRLDAPSQVGPLNALRRPFTFSTHLLATIDVAGGQPSSFPLRVHLNAGGTFSGTRRDPAALGLTPLHEAELALWQFHRLSGGGALEFPFPVVTPFAEYRIAFPLWAQREGGLVGYDGVAVKPGEAIPMSVAFGLKLTPLRDLTVMGAASLALDRTPVRGIPGEPRFNAFVSLSYAFAPWARPPTRAVETMRQRKGEVGERVLETTGRVAGVVLDAQTRRPISDVVIELRGGGVPPVATEKDTGRFITHDAASGPLTLIARKDGYQGVALELLVKPGKLANVELLLAPESNAGTVLVSVTSKKVPIAATVQFSGPHPTKATTQENSNEPLRLTLPPGRYSVEATAPGYQTQARDIQVTERAVMGVSFDLSVQPERVLVTMKENKIEILQQVHFAPNKATILTDSYQLLNQVAEAITKHRLKKVRVEGHTDNRGNKLRNLRLSSQRAQAVGDYLVRQGVDRSRLETVGFGDTKPLAPNLTARGRELNRRVEFFILDR